MHLCNPLEGLRWAHHFGLLKPNNDLHNALVLSLIKDAKPMSPELERSKLEACIRKYAVLNNPAAVKLFEDALERLEAELRECAK